ncbi:MAG: hypothetical protein V4459_03440 [Pseudomonadota bacterium]
MDIHKPKAVHNWREFVNEIGVIVIGVLIALGAEQTVESLHWAHEVEAQRLSLTEEARDSLGSVARRRIQQPCVDRRLSEIHLLLERHSRQQPLGIVGTFASPTRAGSARGTWDIALSGQALPHMSQAERIKFSGAFGTFAVWQELSDRENAIWARLSLLNDVGLLNEADWSALRAAYAEAVEVNDERRNFATFALQSVGRELLGIEAAPVASNATYASLDRQICKPYVAVAGPK